MSLPVPPSTPPRWLIGLVALGLFLTLRGYHSRDGDQAYRLPLLLHRQDPAVYSTDPFVRAFDAFNPHRGYLALLDAASRPLGLSAGLAFLFGLTFLATCYGIDRLARAVWPESGSRVGVVALALVLIAKAGNIGTNHLFEAMLLDRLIAFALGWLALAWVVERPARGWLPASLAIGAAALVHPSIGLQLGMLVGVSWLVWALRPSRTEVGVPAALRAVGALAVAIAPGVLMNLGQGGRLLQGLPVEEFRLLSLEVQGPQHMLPHLWRLPQWLAWGCYPILAVLALKGGTRLEREGPSAWPAARVRLACVLAIALAGLAIAWFGVEVLQDLRLTLFQPFRTATILRGLALVALSGRVLALWRRERFEDRGRAALLVVGLAGDWSLVVATAVDAAAELFGPVRADRAIRGAGALVVLGLGLMFLGRHDTESGHLPLLAALAVAGLVGLVLKGRSWSGNRRRAAWVLGLSWAVPLGSLAASSGWLGERPWARSLAARCRFAAIPADDVERLAVWCREHTPESARFIGPPGPKTFRLWSLRSVAFNRAASPYNAAGLADWSARFRDHVDFQGSTAAFVHAYLADRHALERRYQEMSDRQHADLAVRQGASYVLAAAPSKAGHDETALELLHREGRYAVYRVRGLDPRPLEQVAGGLRETHRGH